MVTFPFNEMEEQGDEPIGARVEYMSNNSGGGWWLKDKDWFALEKAGWKVDWVKNEENNQFKRADKNGRWLGALATTARRRGLSLHDAINEFAEITGQDMNDSGCPCCGTPHNFTEYDDKGQYVASGPEFTTRASW